MQTCMFACFHSTTSMQTAGCGEPIILIHGFGLSSAHYRKTIQELSKQYKVWVGWAKAAQLRFTRKIHTAHWVQLSSETPHVQRSIAQQRSSHCPAHDLQVYGIDLLGFGGSAKPPLKVRRPRTCPVRYPATLHAGEITGVVASLAARACMTCTAFLYCTAVLYGAVG